ATVLPKCDSGTSWLRVGSSTYATVSSPGHRFDFDLFAVLMLPQSLQRQTTASTHFGVVRNIDFLNVCWQV
ncbi:MAG: hypothetical protein WCO86_12105, partial [Planctomycetota bacterium]